jgi:hypothetical protein
MGREEAGVGDVLLRSTAALFSSICLLTSFGLFFFEVGLTFVLSFRSRGDPSESVWRGEFFLFVYSLDILNPEVLSAWASELSAAILNSTE